MPAPRVAFTTPALAHARFGAVRLRSALSVLDYQGLAGEIALATARFGIRSFRTGGALQFGAQLALKSGHLLQRHGD